MKTQFIFILFLLLFFKGSILRAQNDTVSDIPSCVATLLGHFYKDEEVVGFLQNPSFKVEHGKNINTSFYGEDSVLNWIGVHPDFSFILTTENEKSPDWLFYSLGTKIETIIFQAHSQASSERCFKSILAGFKLTFDVKANKQILKKGYYPELKISTHGKVMEVKFMPDKIISTHSYYITFYWNLTEKNNPWLEKIIFNRYGQHQYDEGCFKFSPMSLSRAYVELVDARSYWRALGMTLSDSDKKAFFFDKRDWVDLDSMITSRDGLYTFKFAKIGNSRKVEAVIYNHSSQYCSSPFLYVQSSIADLEKRFGSNYTYRDGYQLYGRDPASSENSMFYADFKTDANHYINKITVKAEKLFYFDCKMNMKLEDMLYPKNCFDGNCQDKIGSKYYSDGYLFIGQWRDYNPDFGPVYNRDKVIVTIIDNRITPEEAEAEEIKKQNGDYETMMAALDKVNSNIHQVARGWNLYLNVMDEYFAYYQDGKREMIDAMKDATRTIVRCQENCDIIIDQTKVLSQIFNQYDFCDKTTPQLKSIANKATDLKKMIYSQMMRMSTYSAQSEFVKDIKRIEGDLDILHRSMREEFDRVVVMYNACVDELPLAE